jgi:hypothetical protein
MKIDFCLLLTGLAAVSGVLNSPRTPAPTPDPLWNPIDPRQFPPAKPTVKEKSEKKKKKKKKKRTRSDVWCFVQDTVQIQYVIAPLLKAEVGPIFGVR